MEADQNPWYPKHEYQKPESFKEHAVMAIISMFKAMTEVHKKEFLKRVTGVSKWQLMEYDDNYIMRLKEAAKDIRDGEKDIAYWNARDARLRKQQNSKAVMAAYEHQRREAAKAKADHEAEMKLFRDLGYLDEDGKFIVQ